MITIGKLTFATKVAAVEHFRLTLYSYPAGIPIPPPVDEELRWLLEQHPTPGNRSRRHRHRNLLQPENRAARALPDRDVPAEAQHAD
jgi:hypothetical protein